MSILWFINNIVFEFIDALMILIVYLGFSNDLLFISKNKLKTFLFCIAYAAVSYWATTYLVGVHSIFITIYLLISINYITKKNVYILIITVLICFLITILIDIVTVLSIFFISHVRPDDIMNDNILALVTLGVGRILIGLAFYALLHVKIKLFSRNIFRKESSYLSFILLATFLNGALLSSTILTGKVDLVSFSITFISFVFLSVFEYFEREKILRAKYEVDLQKEYIKNLDIIVDVIRKEKHDFANHLNTLIAMCMLNKTGSSDNVVTYAKKLINNTSSSYRFYNTGNTYVDGLLAVKSNFAFENQIILDVDFEDSLSLINIYDTDLIAIISNIIDNAFDSLISQPVEKPIVSVYGYVENNKYIISISNNGQKIPEQYTTKIFEKNFSTKSTKSEKERGYGLFIIKQLINKHNGNIEVSSSEDQTEFNVQLNIAAKGVSA